MANKVTKEDILFWIDRAVENENYKNYEIDVLGKTDKGDGYLGEIVFTKVTGVTKDNRKKELNFVVKHGKSNDNLRKTLPVRACFEVEVHFYTKIIPAIRSFQEEYNVVDMFESVPKCYETLILDDMEVLILDNLKPIGFELYDKNKPLNLDHQKKILAEYGKFNALSFALEHKKPKEFSKLTVRPNAGRLFFSDKSVRDGFSTAVNEALEILEEQQEFSLIEKLKNALCKEAGDMIYDFLCDDISETAITHGDCWNNNFMFKYADNDRTSPSKVMMLDWQISALRSPVFDLSHFIYATSSEEQLDRFKDLMEVYYTSFSTFLRSLECDPEELFSYSTFKAHWKKYSLYGILYLPLILKFILAQDSEIPEFADLQEGEDFSKISKISINKKEFSERFKPALRHYFEFEF